jgi:hypothetical protein
MKNLQNLKGAQRLSKKEQQSINGGAPPCGYSSWAQCDLSGCPRTWCRPNTDPNCSGYYMCQPPDFIDE